MTNGVVSVVNANGNAVSNGKKKKAKPPKIVDKIHIVQINPMALPRFSVGFDETVSNIASLIFIRYGNYGVVQGLVSSTSIAFFNL